MAPIYPSGGGERGAWESEAERLVGQSGGFEKRWACGCAPALGASLLAWLVYASSRRALERYLQAVQFEDGKVARHRRLQHPASGLVCPVVWGGGRAGIPDYGRGLCRQAGQMRRLLLGLVLVADLGRANEPWVIYWDYKEEVCQQPGHRYVAGRPYEHRVAMLPFPRRRSLPARPALSGRVAQARVPLLQRSVARNRPDIAQAGGPGGVREGVENNQRWNFCASTRRAWQLTNTRYLLGIGGILQLLNPQTDPAHPGFRIVERFNIGPGRDYPGHRPRRTDGRARLNGPFALIEFTRALPRAKLYSDWQVNTNGVAALAKLADPAFDPERSVFVAGGRRPLRRPRDQRNAGTVEFASYAPKDIVLRSDAPAPSVLLLNDRYDPNWKVRVDGKPETVLRCNYIMRGVYLTPGAHTVEFHFQPPVGPLYVSLAGTGVGLLVLGFVLVTARGSNVPVPARPARPTPVSPASTPNPRLNRLREKTDPGSRTGPNALLSRAARNAMILHTHSPTVS